MTLRIIDQATVREVLTIPVCIGLVEQAMRATALGETLQPARWIIGLPGDVRQGFGLMPGAMRSPPAFGAKLTAVFPENSAKGLQSHRGLIALFDPVDGAPVAIVHGGEVTAVRTAAASALATRALARADASDLAILGTGEQARHHLQAMALVRPLKRVRVWGRSRERTEAFVNEGRSSTGVCLEVAETVEEAVSGASLICTVTAAPEPILAGRWISEGAHVNVVGSSVAAAREIDTDAVECSRFFVDHKPSALLQAGEFLSAVAEERVGPDHILGEIGEVLIGRIQGRQSDRDITIYKSLGIPAEDLVSAHYLYTEAVEHNLGVGVDFDQRN